MLILHNYRKALMKNPSQASLTSRAQSQAPTPSFASYKDLKGGKSNRDLSVSEIKQKLNEEHSPERLQQVRTFENPNMRQRVFPMNKKKVEKEKKQKYLQRCLIDGSEQQIKKRKAREAVSDLTEAVCKKYGIEDIMEKDPELKKKLMLDMQYIKKKEESRTRSKRVSQQFDAISGVQQQNSQTVAHSRAQSRLQSPPIDEAVSSRASESGPLTDLEESETKTVSSSHNSLRTSQDLNEQPGVEISKEKGMQNSKEEFHQESAPEYNSKRQSLAHLQDSDEEGLKKISIIYHKEDIDPHTYSVEDCIRHELNALEAKALEQDNKSFHEHINGMRSNKAFAEYMQQHQKAINEGLKRLDTSMEYRDFYQRVILEYLQQTNVYRVENKEQFDEILYGQEQLKKSIPEIVQQKRKVIAAMEHFKGERSLKIAKVPDDSVANFLSVQEQKQRIHNLVSRRELNHIKRMNYGDYYVSPEKFINKMEKINTSFAKADKRFMVRHADLHEREKQIAQSQKKSIFGANT